MGILGMSILIANNFIAPAHNDNVHGRIRQRATWRFLITVVQMNRMGVMTPENNMRGKVG
eukprot:9646600-Karenia_brevis.AAC.1